MLINIQLAMYVMMLIGWVPWHFAVYTNIEHVAVKNPKKSDFDM